MAKPQNDKILTRGVSLKESEWEELGTIARELNITPHALASYAVRYFLKAWREGKIKIQIKQTKSLPDL
jgi:hypothetical protein